MVEENSSRRNRRSLLRAGIGGLVTLPLVGQGAAESSISAGAAVRTTRSISVSPHPPGVSSLFSTFSTLFADDAEVDGQQLGASQSARAEIPAETTGTVSGTAVERLGQPWWPVCFDDTRFGCSWCPAAALATGADTDEVTLSATQEAGTLAQGDEFATGQRVRTTSDATVRDSPSFDAPGQTVSAGTVGRIRSRSEGQSGGPYSWYRVEFPQLTAWVIQPYLDAAPNSEVEPASVRGTFVRPPSRLSSMKSMIDWYADFGVNRFMLPIFTRGETLYSSNYVTDQGYSDAFLSETIQHAHERDVEIYGWFHNMYLWNLDGFGDVPDGHLLDGSDQICADGNCITVDRSLITETRSGRVTSESGKVFGSPFSTRLRQTLANVAREADQRFDLDGMLFDYVRFPKSRASFGFGRSADYSGRLSGAAQREQAVTDMVAEVAGAVSPGTTTSAAVFPAYYTKNQRSENNKAQDWRSWRYETPLDEFVPMCYGFSSYDDQLAFCETVQDDQHAVYPALAVTGGHDSLDTQLTAWDDYGFPGYFVWKANQINSELP